LTNPRSAPEWFCLRLVIVHYHLRPGGIRRIIEVAVPHLVREAPQPITSVVLATGQSAERAWHNHFERQLPSVPVEVRVDPSFNYLSEQRSSPERITARLRRALGKLFVDSCSGDCLVWAHNLGAGRNLLLARELAAACAARSIPLVAHHHDWWFENRWERWPEMRQFGFRSLAAAALAVFPPRGDVLHASINHADAAVLTRHLGNRASWLPNVSEAGLAPSPTRVRAARHWMRTRLSIDSAPVWVVPCRTLRRKNIAEALLLTRWLQPEAWLLVTGAASSAEEAPYFSALERSAQENDWRLRLGVLAGEECGRPAVSELLVASEAVLLTSVQEGFGLPFLEAAAAHRPLIARRLPNIAPDLHRFGFRFPQAYDDILIAPGLFDWQPECARQRERFNAWRNTVPAFLRARVTKPPMLATKLPCAVPFSRLTLAAQMEVLAHPPQQTWAACLPLNPFLETWRQRAAAQKLRLTPWPRAAEGWLGGTAYAQRFFAALKMKALSYPPIFSSEKLQSEFISTKLDTRNLYPLLWSSQP
jgi:hypothetical protein